MLTYYDTSEYVKGVSFFYFGYSAQNINPIPIKYLYSADCIIQYNVLDQNWTYIKDRYGGQGLVANGFNMKSSLVISTYDLTNGLFKPVELDRDAIPYFRHKSPMSGKRFYLFNMHPNALGRYLETYNIIIGNKR